MLKSKKGVILKILLSIFLSTYIIASTHTNKIDMHGGNYDSFSKKSKFSNTVKSPFIQKKKLIKIDEIKIDKIKNDKEKKNGK